MSKPKKKRPEGPSLDDELSIWEYIHDIICDMKLHEDVDEELFRRYLDEQMEIKYTVQQLIDYFNESMRPTLFKSDLPIEKILELYKTLEIEMTSHAEMMLEAKYSVTLRIDSDRVLRSFSFFSPKNKQQVAVPNAPKNLPTSAPEDVTRKRKNLNLEAPWDLEISEEFEKEIWEYIRRKSSRLSSSSLISYEFWAEMVEKFPSLPVKSPLLLLNHFKENMLKKLWKQRLDPIFKLEVYKELKLPFKQHQKNWFSEKEGVEVDVSDDGFVENWEMIDRDDSMEITQRARDISMFVSPPKPNLITWVSRNNSDVPNGQSTSAAPPPRRSRSPEPDEPDLSYDFPTHRHSSRPPPPPPAFNGTQKRQIFTLDEQINAWKYIHSKIKNCEKLEVDMVLPKGIIFWNEYVRKTDTTKTASSWNSHFRRQMIPNLHDIGLGRDVILYLYRNIDIEVDKKLKRILQRKFNAEILLDRGGNVISWKFLDQPNPKEEEIEEESEDAPEIDDNSSYDTTLPLDEAMRENEEEEEEENSADSVVKTEPESPARTAILTRSASKRLSQNQQGTSEQSSKTPRRSARFEAHGTGSSKKKKSQKKSPKNNSPRKLARISLKTPETPKTPARKPEVSPENSLETAQPEDPSLIILKKSPESSETPEFTFAPPVSIDSIDWSDEEDDDSEDDHPKHRNPKEETPEESPEKKPQIMDF